VAGLEWLQNLGVPVTVEVGNHDLPYFNPIARFFRPYHRIDKIERVIEKPLDLPGVAIVPMVTTGANVTSLAGTWVSDFKVCFTNPYKNKLYPANPRVQLKSLRGLGPDFSAEVELVVYAAGNNFSIT